MSEKAPQEDLRNQLLIELLKKYPPNLTQKQYCEITGKSESTAEQDRLYGRGSRFARMGRSIRYPIDAVVDYLLSLPRFRSTTEADEHEHAA